MLVLARKPNQSIMIGNNIEIHVVEVKGDQVKLGINAPREVEVHRKEVFEEIQRANQSAAKTAGTTNLKDASKILIRKQKK
jgi:carbon storage regulator